MSGGYINNRRCEDLKGSPKRKSELKRCTTCDEKIDPFFYVDQTCPYCHPSDNSYRNIVNNYFEAKRKYD